MRRKCKMCIPFVHFKNTFLEKTTEPYNEAVTYIMHAMNGRTEGSILVSYIILDMCSSLSLTHDRHANMAHLVKLL